MEGRDKFPPAALLWAAVVVAAHLPWAGLEILQLEETAATVRLRLFLVVASLMLVVAVAGYTPAILLALAALAAVETGAAGLPQTGFLAPLIPAAAVAAADVIRQAQAVPAAPAS